jgi:3-deoxy-D-arabino-heptulosonate 7-phosphate (DAHP) synthase class II
MPDYPDKAALEAAEAELKGCSPLVFAGEVRKHIHAHARTKF